MKYVGLLLLMATTAMANIERLEGTLIYEVGDGWGGYETHQSFYLQTKDALIPLDASEAFKQKMPLHVWSGKQVSVMFKPGLQGEATRLVQSIELMEGESNNRGGISGSQKWISLLCKFSDNNDEPENLSYFQQMYANTPAGLDHYWREVSYNQVNVAGSIAVDWVDLPFPQSTYAPTPGSGSDSDKTALFNDCTAAADPFVNFSNGFVGINMMFNDVLDCCAWGGGRGATLDGQSQFWRVTWNPPWAYRSIAVIAHEMGHGFGLPHANNSDDDGFPYDSPWDVMSAATGYAVNDSVYGRLGKHINMEFKHNLGWVDDTVGYIADASSNDEITIVNTTNPAVGTGYRFARIQLSDGTHYVVEARKEEGNYESNIPGTVVIIHHVDYGRGEPPWVIDADNPPADYADTEGVMWRAGETFVDPIDGYRVEILNLLNAGHRVRISALEDLIFADGFD